MNADPAIHGILVQSPPPPHIDEEEIVVAIDPAKDVDGFHPMNVGKLAMGDPTALVPCTPLGCQSLLLESGIETTGAHVVIIGRSMLVGKPLALLLMRKGKGGDATVTIAHSRSRNLADISRTADILVAAIGKPEFVRGEYVKEGAVVIDVGINRVEDPASESGYRITGDVAFEETASKDKGHHTGTRRGRSNDRRDVDGQYSDCLREPDGICRLTMHSFHYQRGKLTCESYPLDKAAERYGTPLYVYSSQTIVDHYQRLDQAVAGAASRDLLRRQSKFESLCHSSPRRSRRRI